MNSYELFIADSSSDDENEVSSEFMMFAEECWDALQASQPKVSRNQINRDRLGAHNRLVAAYFCENPRYGDQAFHDHFRMTRRLFTRIVREVTDHSPYFQQTPSCTGLLGISPLMKCTSSIRQLAYGVNPNALDEFVQIGGLTIRECLQKFCEVIMELYGPEYLRKPTVTDIDKLYAHHYERHGFPGMIGSIDCTDWSWENCPHALKAQFCRGDHGQTPFILLEAIASQDLWIWHAFFGVTGMNNDINVLRKSPIFNDLKTGRAPGVEFYANGVPYKRRYYLADGIYPEYSVIVKSIKNPGTGDDKRILYKTMHEAARKDVERAFGVLKKKWLMIKHPAKGFDKERLSHLMYTCNILHNMIIQDEGRAISPTFFPVEQHRSYDPIRTHVESLKVTREIVNKTTHLSLKADLVEDIWHRHNQNY